MSGPAARSPDETLIPTRMEYVWRLTPDGVTVRLTDGVLSPEGTDGRSDSCLMTIAESLASFTPIAGWSRASWFLRGSQMPAATT